MPAAITEWMKYAIGLSYVLIATACGTTDMAAADPDPQASGPGETDPMAPDQPDQGDDPGVVQAGSLQNAPSIMMGGATKVAVTMTSDGPQVQIDGGIDLASYGRASYWIPMSGTNVTTEFTVNLAPGASFQFEMMGTGNGYSTRQLRLQRVPGSTGLEAAAKAGIVTCGPLPFGTPTAVSLTFDTVSQTFDVLIDGAQSACTDLPASLIGPVRGFRMIDAGNADYGGRAVFTNLALY